MRYIVDRSTLALTENTKKMLPSSATPHQEFPLPREAAYLYLLASRREPETFKVGITRRPAMRFEALTKRFGDFDLEASVLVVAKNRRAALDLEAILKSVFAAPVWRAEPPVATAKKGRGKHSDGDTEWYRSRAFEPMVGFVTALAEHDGCCDLHRFSVVRNIQDCDLWRDHLRNLGVQTRFRSPADVARKAQEALIRNEVNFASVQKWMEQHRHKLVSATPVTGDANGNRQRTFVYRDDDSHGANSDEPGSWGEDGLASACVVSHVSEHGSKHFTYFGGSTMTADGSTSSVEFMLTPSFTRAATDCPALSDLLTRIEDWLGTLPA